MRDPHFPVARDTCGDEGTCRVLEDVGRGDERDPALSPNLRYHECVVGPTMQVRLTTHDLPYFGKKPELDLAAAPPLDISLLLRCAPCYWWPRSWSRASWLARRP